MNKLCKEAKATSTIEGITLNPAEEQLTPLAAD
jgi:hypothetical protein